MSTDRYHAEVDEVPGLHLAQPGVALVVLGARRVQRRRVGRGRRQRGAAPRARVPGAEPEVLLVVAPLHQSATAQRMTEPHTAMLEEGSRFL